MPAAPLRVAVLFSGRGSNLQSLAQHMAQESVPATCALAITNRPQAGGIEFCAAQGIDCQVIDHTAYTTRAAFDADLHAALLAANIDLICCAGFMRLLTAEFVALWHDRLINIHPSLLPAYKGLNTHARALEDGATTHGCTVHIMRAEMDDGPILVQKRVAVADNDTVETLAARVLAQEHIAYPEALDLMVQKIRKKMAGSA
jgi:phosphoribosylglycinamide formyltransferase-1